MSSLPFALLRENPLPGLAVASLNVIVAVCLVALSVLLGITIAMIAWAHTLATRQPGTVRLDRRTVA
ncbi:hypothetical protein [Bradyrhizobium sp. USDA 4454]